MQVGAGLGAAAFALAVTFGAAAVQAGWGPVAPIVASLVVFSGSAQFALLIALAGGGGLVPAVASSSLVLARFVPMAVALAPSLRGGVLRRVLTGQAVVDGSWVAAHLGGGRFDPIRLLGASIPQWPAWVAGTALGVWLAPEPELIETLALDVVFPAFFLVLLIDELRSSHRARAAAVLGGGLAGALVALVPTGVAIIGAAPAALIGLIRPRPDDRPDARPQDPG